MKEGAPVLTTIRTLPYQGGEELLEGNTNAIPPPVGLGVRRIPLRRAGLVYELTAASEASVHGHSRRASLTGYRP